MGPEAEFEEYDRTGLWGYVYHKIRTEASLQHDFSLKDAKRPDFRGRNRYRDVSPYDHSRVELQRDGLDYINASLLRSPLANRNYILTQGPLPTTAGHFWLMVWEQDSKAVLMLNRVMEKGQIKCHQYFPTGSENQGIDFMVFDDVGLQVHYISQQSESYYVIRTLQIEDMESGETKQILQFHYTTWPDMDVPKSPTAFLDFLFAVRRSGALEADVGPPVIHCSAGIGRSGTFCLVDTCLVLIEQRQESHSINVQDILMDMRRYRMGLIQTPDQLRFSYLAIIEGARRVLSASPDSGYSEYDGEKVSGSLYNGVQTADDVPTERPPVPPRRQLGIPDDSMAANSVHNNPGEEIEENMADDMGDFDPDVYRKQGVEIRRRKREERLKNTADQLSRMRQKQTEGDKWHERRSAVKPYVNYIGLSLAVLIGGYLFYRLYLT